jgi:hypothetical protein
MPGRECPRSTLLDSEYTECSEQEMSSLRWEWQQPAPALEIRVFIIPRHTKGVKKREHGLVVLHCEAKALVE